MFGVRSSRFFFEAVGSWVRSPTADPFPHRSTKGRCTSEYLNLKRQWFQTSNNLCGRMGGRLLSCLVRSTFQLFPTKIGSSLYPLQRFGNSPPLLVVGTRWYRVFQSFRPFCSNPSQRFGLASDKIRRPFQQTLHNSEINFVVESPPGWGFPGLSRCFSSAPTLLSSQTPPDDAAAARPNFAESPKVSCPTPSETNSSSLPSASEALPSTRPVERSTASDKLSSLFQIGLAFCYVTSGVAAIYLAYVLHKCGYNVGKFELYLFIRFNNLLFGKKIQQEAAVNSSFQSAFKEPLQDHLATFFIQLDADKENGVRRSDVIEFVQNEVGWDVQNTTAKNDFLQNAKGRTLEAKLLSGCSLQECIDFFESLCLEISHPTTESTLEAPPVPSFADLQDELLDCLKKANKGAMDDRQNAALPAGHLQNFTVPYVAAVKQITDAIGEVPEDGISTNEFEPEGATEVEMIQLEMEQKEKLVSQLTQLKKRRGGVLSEAEASRLAEAKELIKFLRKEKRTFEKQSHTQLMEKQLKRML